MLKKLALVIMSVVLAATMLCGCTFFTHDTERDLQQVVATVDGYDITKVIVVDDGLDDDGFPMTHTESVTYHAEPVNIYKRDIIEYVNNNASSLSQQFSGDLAGLYRYAVRMLINIELVINEVDALIKSGEIKWYSGTFDDPTMREEDGESDYTQYNAVKRSVYNVVNSTLMSIKNEILEERNRPTVSTDGDSEQSTSTTYPVKSEETNDDDIIETEPWQVSLSRYPGISGDDDMQSLEKEAMRRFINVLEKRVDGDFRATDDDRAKFAKDKEAIQKIIDTDGVSYVYPMIGETHLMYYVSARQIERSLKVSALQNYLTKHIEVTDAEVMSAYTTTLNEQTGTYTADLSAFDTAMSNKTTVLYYPNDNYFYVKHILLPFSDAQKADLDAYKSRIDVNEDQIKAYRDSLVQGIVAYPHVDGEDDKTRPMTVAEVMNEIRARMLPLEVNVHDADLAFDDLIFKYNTDPGAFNNNKGYVVKYKLNEDESETYMQEFADGARYMRDNLAVGQVYYEPVVTDYGVHIMYFASTTTPGAVSINQYTTPGEVQTYYDILKEPIETARNNAAYSKWESEVLMYNYNAHSYTNEDTFKDLWED